MSRTPEPAPTDVGAACLVAEGEAVLLVRETKPEALGRWGLPGGRVETGETLREAAAREVVEETGLVVEVGVLLGIYHTPVTLEGRSAVTFVFRATAMAGEPTPTDDHPEMAFLNPPQIEALAASNMIRGRLVAQALDAWRNGTALPEHLITELGPSDPPTDG